MDALFPGSCTGKSLRGYHDPRLDVETGLATFRGTVRNLAARIRSYCGLTLDIGDPMSTPTEQDQNQNQMSPAAESAIIAASEAGRTASTLSRSGRAQATSEFGHGWVPVRSLAAHHRPRFVEHLLGLDEDDRRLRFGYPATDAQIARYVDGIDFERDELFGIFNRKVELIAAAHLAYAPPPQIDGVPAMAEFGVSVLPHARGRGFGARLFDHAILHARNRGIGKLFIHALSENTAMLRIVQKAGATVVRDGSESEAWLKLPPETIASRFDEVVGQHAAEIDYQFKWHAHRVHDLWDLLSTGRNPFAAANPAAND
ncbi:N-acetyltransferase family protein [Piscinibacter sakaiensis]|uniref:N-acetyltransferase family protein n=1 Tax=Piscinibacter sakaiensis TaxID=1547922 RepID=UPI003AAB2F0C